MTKEQIKKLDRLTREVKHLSISFSNISANLETMTQELKDITNDLQKTIKEMTNNG